MISEEEIDRLTGQSSKAKARYEIIVAGTALAGLLTEEQWNEIISAAEKSYIIDTKTSYRVMGKLIDLAQAVQDAES
jgi:hypothetical protein